MAWPIRISVVTFKFAIQQVSRSYSHDTTSKLKIQVFLILCTDVSYNVAFFVLSF